MLARFGFIVTAVEPAAEMRKGARQLHPSYKIEWVDDGLADLAAGHALDESFDTVFCTAVQAKRVVAMTPMASLVAAGGLLSITLRYGQVPPGSRTFCVEPGETVAHATATSLRSKMKSAWWV